ncbi:hypothetical protein HHK36_017449 [Tetracentron sinense]|uniref:non-specific serine/threonine protein kinase n=1 Tax=Tetracentron sinense TaxID=13715 RepID=A0A834Z388_TETSI|nr:hypothetical protein HHK36_017449 [Tetracentron sinense]
MYKTRKISTHASNRAPVNTSSRFVLIDHLGYSSKPTPVRRSSLSGDFHKQEDLISDFFLISYTSIPPQHLSPNFRQLLSPQRCNCDSGLFLSLFFSFILCKSIVLWTFFSLLSFKWEIENPAATSSPPSRPVGDSSCWRQIHDMNFMDRAINGSNPVLICVSHMKGLVMVRSLKAQVLLLVTLLLGGAVMQVACLNFSYPIFPEAIQKDFTFDINNSEISQGALQVTREKFGDTIPNLSGRIVYKNRFKLWNKRNNSRTIASFNSTFLLNIKNETEPASEGMAFILTKEYSIPENSDGKWLGIVNESTNGSSQIVAVEFDTRKSYLEDGEDNHVGLDLNSIYSTKLVQLSNYSVDHSDGTNIAARIQYDGKSKRINIYVSMNSITVPAGSNPIISEPLDLSHHLPEDVYVGFSASTGSNHAQLNCVRSWNFTADDMEEDRSDHMLWLWITIPVVVLIILFSAGLACYLYSRHAKEQADQSEYPIIEDIEGSTIGPRKFRFKELKSATGNFHYKHQLGKGGFGTVYKGFLKGVNMEVAVKRVSKESRQGKQEFIAEVTTISRLRHKNLVKLIGWCYERTELLLVYEFMPKGSLEKLIFSDKSSIMEEVILSWERRHNIICGVAYALDYLHNGCDKRVLHRDVKSSNVMLDSEFNARLGDFGLARIVQNDGNTHHSTKEIAGTPGYMAPECFHTGIASVETDVYGFGVFVLEVACGRRPGNQKDQNNYNNSIVDWVWELYGGERILDAVDPRLGSHLNKEQKECVLKLGLACCHPNPYQRPSMRIASQVLTGETAPPVLPIEKPAFMWPATNVAGYWGYLDCSVSEGQLTQARPLSPVVQVTRTDAVPVQEEQQGATIAADIVAPTQTVVAPTVAAPVSLRRSSRDRRSAISSDYEVYLNEGNISSTSRAFVIAQNTYSMFHVNLFVCFSLVAKVLLLITLLLGGAVIQVACLNFSYPDFGGAKVEDFIFDDNKSEMSQGGLQVTREIYGDAIPNLSGRIVYKNRFKLWNKRNNSRTIASFNSTFKLNINNETQPAGEGLAFILTKEPSIPENSEGKWLGIVNENTNGSSRQIVAVEFDTRNSYLEDGEDNHVGLDLNSIYSIKQVRLSNYSVDLSNGNDVTASIQYDGKLKKINIYVSMTSTTVPGSNPIISEPLDLSDHLPEDVYVGFSASTGVDHTQLNCVRSWNFTAEDIEEDRSAHMLWLWITIPVVVLIILFSAGLACYLYSRHAKEQADQSEYPIIEDIEGSTIGPRKFRFKELKSATGNFHSKNQLGRGGFGTVYKGFLKGVNMEVAVKRVSKESRRGKQEFIAEVTTISRLRHKNLVKLIGWCYERTELLLVYEFMPRGSLDKLIFSDKSSIMEEVILSWERRHNIICGVAYALDYLHNGCDKRVLHRDVKSSNIMLDSEFNARLGDFGLARIVQNDGNTHHSTNEIAGTPGYMAPECFHTGIASVETDVYGFGVFVLEVTCGRRPGHQKHQNNFNNSIVDWVWELYGGERILDAVDPRLGSHLYKKQKECALKLGLACCHPNPYQRPSMRIASQFLTGETAPPILPFEKPAFMWPAAMVVSSWDCLDCSLSGGQLTQSTDLTGR